MNKKRAEEIQHILGIGKPVESDQELRRLGVEGWKYGLAFWEVCEAVWHMAKTLHNKDRLFRSTIGRKEKG